MRIPSVDRQSFSHHCRGGWRENREIGNRGKTGENVNRTWKDEIKKMDVNCK